MQPQWMEWDEKGCILVHTAVCRLLPSMPGEGLVYSAGELQVDRQYSLTSYPIFNCFL